jgi:hypothetical protein
MLTASALAAQSADWNVVKSLLPGEPIRVEGSRKVRGQSQSATDDAIVVRTGGTEETVPRAQVTLIAGSKRGHRKRNALIGLAVGAGAGLGIGLAGRCTGTCLQIVPNGAVVAGATAGGAVVGLVVGFLVPSGGWREIYRFKPAPMP